jgi:hypothetical protein
MQTSLLLDRADKRIIAVTSQDVEPILERNKALQAEPQPARRRGDWGRHIGTIPNVILVKWMNEEGANVLKMSSDEFGKFIRKKLDDPDWRYLRTDK